MQIIFVIESAGEAVISATVQDTDCKAECKVKVYNHVESVTLNKKTEKLVVNETLQLIATVSPDNLKNDKVVWSSSNPSCAKVDQNGLVTALKAGNAVITVASEEDGSKNASCEIEVVVPVVSVALDKSELSLNVGESSQLNAVVLPADATNRNVIWSSSDPSVAVVSSSGKVTAVSGGTAIITVTTEDGGLSVSCKVTVLVPVSGVSLDKNNLSLAEGQSYTLTATVSPSDANDKSVRWTSADESVATVTVAGVVTAVAKGSTTISVTTNDGGFEASCIVTVRGETEPSMEMVDLGLSVKWANCNLGATSPEELGGYYQWAGVDDVSDTNIYLYWDNCPYHTGTKQDSGWTKYNSKYSYGKVDGKTVLDQDDDAAHVKLGSPWRIPTNNEWNELRSYCTWVWTDNYNKTGVAGYIVTSNKSGYEKNSIFLPAAGDRYYSKIYNVGTYGYYWSSSLNTNYPYGALDLRFTSETVESASFVRYYALSIRPVQ